MNFWVNLTADLLFFEAKQIRLEVLRGRVGSLLNSIALDRVSDSLFKGFCYSDQAPPDATLDKVTIRLQCSPRDDLLSAKQNLRFFSQEHFENMLDAHYDAKPPHPETITRGRSEGHVIRGGTPGTLCLSGLKDNVSELEARSVENDDCLGRSGEFDLLSGLRR